MNKNGRFSPISSPTKKSFMRSDDSVQSCRSNDEDCYSEPPPTYESNKSYKSSKYLDIMRFIDDNDENGINSRDGIKSDISAISSGFPVSETKSTSSKFVWDNWIEDDVVDDHNNNFNDNITYFSTPTLNTFGSGIASNSTSIQELVNEVTDKVQTIKVRIVEYFYYVGHI
jgi:hypothetical protein